MAEKVIILYFSSLGLGVPAVTDLVNLKCNLERSREDVTISLKNAKDYNYNYDFQAEKWNLSTVGKSLAKLMSDHKEFERVTWLGPEEKEKFQEGDFPSQTVEQLHVYKGNHKHFWSNEVLMAYYKAVDRACNGPMFGKSQGGPSADTKPV